MTLTNKRGKYYARLRVWNGVKEKDSLIPLQTRLKTDAIRRFKVVQSHENDLKSGIIQKFQYEDYFEWMNDEGASKLIKRRLNDVIPDYLAYRQTKKRYGTVNRDRISLNQLTNFLGNKAIDELSYEDIEGTDGLIPYLQRNGYKNTGINISLRHIKTFFGWLYNKKRMIPEPIKFEMIDENGMKQQVLFAEPIPTDFTRSEQVVIVGAYQGDKFVANKILLKCPSKYQEDPEFTS